MPHRELLCQCKELEAIADEVFGNNLFEMRGTKSFDTKAET